MKFKKSNEIMVIEIDLIVNNLKIDRLVKNFKLYRILKNHKKRPTHKKTHNQIRY